MKLPYLTTPAATEKVQIGNEKIGVLELSKLGDFSPNERKWLKDNTKHIPNLRKEAVRMAREIGEEIGQPTLDVYNALTSGDTEYLATHLEKIMEFQDQMEVVTEQRSLFLATMILKFRVVADWTIEDTGNADVIRPELVKEVALFAAKEENGWATEAQTAEPTTEADLGKS